MPNPMQLDLFAGPDATESAKVLRNVGEPVKRGTAPKTIFDHLIKPEIGSGTSPAQRSAMAFLQNDPSLNTRYIGRPQPHMGTQSAFWSPPPPPKPTTWGKFAKGARSGAKDFVKGPGLAIEAALIGAITIAGAIEGSAQWGAPTGLEEDYVGGAVYGTIKGFGTGVGGAIGGFTGMAMGAAVGSIIPGIGTAIGGTVGGLVGAIAGTIPGEIIGGNLLQRPAAAVGRGARAIVRTSRAVDTVQFGGNFVDSQGAYTMRQRAVADMSGSMLNARQFLGNEAIFLHER